mmetsp:Transcript_32768/g.33114  ORF Transcript_32768/g.33114 Transcript_32768/m.33114 type:complete len:91 (-) Transcript_32768:358-630(-)
MYLCIIVPYYILVKTIPHRDNSFLLKYIVFLSGNTDREYTTNSRPKWRDNKTPGRIEYKIYVDDCPCRNDPDSVSDCNKYLHRRHTKEIY